ncbi:MAG: DUF4912 domain-containing protein [Merismopedia sp. SIO2A8]|nr:DUF4912 domain-containing protein [Merismopedia sp. SIO2A8]
MRLPIRSASTLALLAVLAIAPQSVVASSRPMPLFAQAPTLDTDFPVPTSVPSGTTITISSSGSLAGINEVIGQRFENQFSGTEVTVNYSSSDEALTALANGQVDVAAIGRPLTEAEKAQGYTEVLLSRSKIALIVSEDNPFAGEITTIGFSELFRGEITDWSEFEGGNPGTIRLVDRPTSSDTRQALGQYPVFQSKPFQAAPNATTVDIDSTEAVIAALGTDGIGYAIADHVLNRPGIRVLPMHKVPPTNPSYPFSQPLSYVYKGDASPAVQAFLGYAKSPAITDVVDDAKALGAEATFGGLQDSPRLDESAFTTLVGASPAGADVSSTTGETGTSSEAGTPSTGTTPPNSTSTGASDTTSNSPGTTPNGDGGSGEDGTTATDQATSPTNGSESAGTENTGTDIANDASVATNGAGADGATGTEGTETAIAPSPAQTNFSWWWIWLLGVPPLGALLWWILKGKNRDEEDVPPIAGVDPATIVPSVPARNQSTRPKSSSRSSSVTPSIPPSKLQNTNRVLSSPTAPTPDLAELSFPDSIKDATTEVDAPKPNVRLPKTDASFPIPDTRASLSSPDASLPRAEDRLVDPEARIPDAEATMPDFDTAILEPDVANEGDSSVSNDPRIPAGGMSTVGAAIAGIAGVAGVSKLTEEATDTPQVSPDSPVLDNTSTTQDPVQPVSQSPQTVFQENHITLVPQGGNSAHVSWEVSEETKAALRQKGGQKLALRLYDITGINPRTQRPHDVQPFDCNEQDCDRHVTVPKEHRSYLADLGYTTKDGKWLRLAHSVPVQIPAMSDDDEDWKQDDDGTGGDDPEPTAPTINDRLPIEEAPIFDDGDRTVPVPLSDKDYLAELGYVSNDGSWLRLGRSLHARIPSTPF